MKDQKLLRDLAFIGFNKAFDKVSYNGLLSKLNNIGTSGNFVLGTNDFIVGH